MARLSLRKVSALPNDRVNRLLRPTEVLDRCKPWAGKKAVPSVEPIDPVLDLALAWQPSKGRSAFATLLEFDARLGSVLVRAREPMLAQLRFAWWRDRLGEPVSQRPTGEAMLARLTRDWEGSEAVLTALVDGWEELIGEAPLPAEAINRFAGARGAALGEFASRSGQAESRDPVEAAGRRWALADFALRTSNSTEQETALSIARAMKPASKLPRAVRGIAVLSALADRAIRSGEPLGSGRGAALTALRVGLIGR
jgi:phytoene synthase